MRIVGGTLSGRRFAGPKGDGTRPTSERVREAVASALESRGGFEGTRVLDLYAGTGALAFEALSRGAERATLVDRDPAVTRAISDAASALGLATRCTVLRLDLTSPTAVPKIVAGGAPFDRVFVDAPYAEMAPVRTLLEALRTHGALHPGAVVVVEHQKKNPPASPHGFQVISERVYGDTAVLFLTPDEDVQ